MEILFLFRESTKPCPRHLAPVWPHPAPAQINEHFSLVRDEARQIIRNILSVEWQQQRLPRLAAITIKTETFILHSNFLALLLFTKLVFWMSVDTGKINQNISPETSSELNFNQNFPYQNFIWCVLWWGEMWAKGYQMKTILSFHCWTKEIKWDKYDIYDKGKGWKYYKALAVFACWFLCSPIQTNKLFSFVRYTFISISYNRSCEKLLLLLQKSQNCTKSFQNCFF